VVKVRGRLIFPDDCPVLTAANATVEVRDVSIADLPSTLVGHVVFVNIELVPNGVLPFSIEVGQVDLSRSFGVRAHVDVNGDGKVAPGDLISTQSLPVLTHGAPNYVVVPMTVI